MAAKQKLFENPKGEIKTSHEWAKIHEYKNAEGFRAYYRKCVAQGRVEDAFTSEDERKKIALKSLQKTAKIYKNPITGKEKTARGWADHLGMTISGWFTRLREYGPDSPKTYLTKEEAEQGRGEAIRQAKSGKEVERGPFMPYTRRRGNLKKIKIGTWEEKNVPDRWAHLVGEP